MTRRMETAMRYTWLIVFALVFPALVTTAAAQPPARTVDCAPLAWEEKNREKIAGFWGTPKNMKGEVLKDRKGNTYSSRLMTPVFIGLESPAPIGHGVDVSKYQTGG